MTSPLLAFISPQMLLLLLVVAIFVFGPKRIPEIGKSLGEGIRDFKGALNAGDANKDDKK